MTRPRRLHGARGASFVILLPLLFADPAAAAPRERAVEQLPELMSRILESQEEIREHEDRFAPIVESYNEKLTSSRDDIESASTEDEASEALVDYVEAYNQRLETQAEGLRAIGAPIARMYADARQLARAAREVSRDATAEDPETRRAFLQDHYQGVASGISALGEQLGRNDEAAISGTVLTAGWAASASPEIPLAKLGPEATLVFARRTEALYARYQARSRQLETERFAVRQLLELLIERQLAHRMDTLFADSGGLLAGLLSSDGRTESWLDLGDVVQRALGLPSASIGAGALAQSPSGGRLEYFALGRHRE